MYVCFLMFVTFSGTVCTCEFYLLFVWFMCMYIWAKYLKYELMMMMMDGWIDG